MEALAGAFDLSAALHARGVDLSGLGAAYLVFLASLLLTLALFTAARSYLVVAPNRYARDYAIYVTAVLTTLAIATVLENELLPSSAPALQYVAFPQLVVLIMLHLWIAYRQEPWIIELGASAIGGSVAVVAVAALTTNVIRVAHVVTLLVFVGLLAFLWLRAISTKRGFLTASSIYIASKETLDASVAPQKPWLGLAQWVALIVASVLLALLNSVLRGSGIEQIPAVDVAFESGLLLLVTTTVCAVPAGSYWLARKAWMPELTRFVWLVWIVVGFAFTYGNYLSSLNQV
jgi:hypothetical protein